MKNTNKHYIIIILLVMLIVSILTFNIYKYNNTLKNKIINSNVIEVNHEINKINYEEELYKVRNKYNNNDIVGILSNSLDTLNEIVMQSTDNDYYLEHTIYHEYNWRGQTFLDYRNDINNSDKLIIYGHNSNYYNLPFKVLENYYNKSYYDENKYLYLQTDLNKYKYEIFSVYVEVSDWEYYNKMKFNTKNEYYNHILKLKNKSMYDTNVSVNEDDKILIIQTCSTKKEYSNYENKFLLIIAKRV